MNTKDLGRKQPKILFQDKIFYITAVCLMNINILLRLCLIYISVSMWEQVTTDRGADLSTENASRCYVTFLY